MRLLESAIATFVDCSGVFVLFALFEHKSSCQNAKKIGRIANFFNQMRRASNARHICVLRTGELQKKKKK
jgi:hypothetical protein